MTRWAAPSGLPVTSTRHGYWPTPGHPDELVAEHLLAAEPVGDPQVVERLARAASTAAHSGAPESAAAYLLRGLAEPPEPARRSELLLQLGVAESNAGHPGAIGHLEQGVETAVDGPARAAAGLALAYALVELHDNRIIDSVRVLDETIASFGGDDTALARSVETVAVAVARLDADMAAKNQSRIRAARQRAKTVPAPSRDVLALSTLIAMQTNEPAQVAADLARRSLHARSEQVPGSVALPQQSLIQAEAALMWSECHDELRPVLDTGIRDARNSGDALLLAGSLAYRAGLAPHLGDLRAAEADARTALEAVGMPVPAFHRVLNTAAAVDALTGQGRLGDAEKLLAAENDLVEGSMLYDASLGLSRGRLRLAQLRADEALADFLRAGHAAQELGMDSPGWIPWRSSAALACLIIGDTDRARQLAQGELALARTFGAPRTLGVALHTAGLAVGGSDGERLLREAIASLGRAGAVLDRARALCDLGAQLRRGNRRADSRELLREALDIAHRAGAAPLASRAQIELRATGARPRRAVLTGADALTASERRIAELAATGLTNRQIAQALFITARTVEGHLTSVFRKLAIDSREQLPAALLTAPAWGLPCWMPS
jgi:DNA-binding CsgD family transcriptional regulator